MLTIILCPRSSTPPLLQHERLGAFPIAPQGPILAFLLVSPTLLGECHLHLGLQVLKEEATAIQEHAELQSGQVRAAPSQHLTRVSPFSHPCLLPAELESAHRASSLLFQTNSLMTLHSGLSMASRQSPGLGTIPLLGPSHTHLLKREDTVLRSLCPCTLPLSPHLWASVPTYMLCTNAASVTCLASVLPMYVCGPKPLCLPIEMVSLTLKRPQASRPSPLF